MDHLFGIAVLHGGGVSDTWWTWRTRTSITSWAISVLHGLGQLLGQGRGLLLSEGQSCGEVSGHEASQADCGRSGVYSVQQTTII